MNFQGLAKVEKAQWYLDLAFRNAKKIADEIKGQKRAGPDSIKKAEMAKVRAISRVVRRHFDLILKSFPSIDGLPEFYQELVRSTLDYAELKKSLGALKWAQQKTDHFSDMYHNKIKRCRDFRKMTSYSREYYGRISSVIKQVSKPLDYLEEARKMMKSFPSVKTKLFTVCIAGFPNVGKTTLLSKLTGADPEIAAYAFTTKNLNIGYAQIKNHRVQFIDTPGTLSRFEKMNPIEKQAHLAIKYCAELIVFVFDPTGQSYPLDKQVLLLKDLKKMGKDVLIYISKTDLDIEFELPKEVSKGSFSDPKELKLALSDFI